MQLIALLLVLALGLPAVIGTIVVIKDAFDDKPAIEGLVQPRAAIPPFGSVGFRVGDSPTQYCALLADTVEAQQQGMQNRRDLGGYDAMVFAFDRDETVSFVNHFVPVDLQIGWYDSAGKLVDHTTMDKCPDGIDCPTYAARTLYRYAVETLTGGLDDLGLTDSGATLHVGGSC